MGSERKEEDKRMRAAEEKQYRRQNAYNAAKYDKIGLMLPKGSKEKIKAEACKKNMSVNAYITELIKRELEL